MVEKSKLSVKLAVFLCSPKNNGDTATAATTTATTTATCRLSLLWHSESKDLDHASKDFARLLRATADFNRWREKEPTQSWTCLGPNCCKVDAADQVRCNLTLAIAGIQLPEAVSRSY
jgi:hypothetical protein